MATNSTKTSSELADYLLREDKFKSVKGNEVRIYRDFFAYNHRTGLGENLWSTSETTESP